MTRGVIVRIPIATQERIAFFGGVGFLGLAYLGLLCAAWLWHPAAFVAALALEVYFIGAALLGYWRDLERTVQMSRQWAAEQEAAERARGEIHARVATRPSCWWIAIPILLALSGTASAQSRTPAQIVEDARAQYAAERVTKPEVAVIIQTIVRDLNAEGVAEGPFGRLIKTSGTSCGGYSCDIVCVGNGAVQKQWDVLENAVDKDGTPGTAEPRWTPLTTIVVRPCETDPAPPVDPSKFYAALDALIARVNTLEQQNDQLRERVNAVGQKVDQCDVDNRGQDDAITQLRATIFDAMRRTPSCKGRLWGVFNVPMSCRVEQ